LGTSPQALTSTTTSLPDATGLSTSSITIGVLMA
jgi:hypothetical protein